VVSIPPVVFISDSFDPDYGDSEKKIWLLQYGIPDSSQAATKEQLAAGMEIHCPKLAKLFMSKDVHVRSLSMDNIDVVLGEIAKTW
jgi:hypothetical protein